MTCCGSDGGASCNGRSDTTDESAGGVPIDGLLNLVRALIGCGVSPDVAAQSATTLYATQSCAENANSAVSGTSSARAARSKQRHMVWGASMSALPYQDGQCYLHPVRWGRRVAYAKALGVNPAFSDFVAMLRPGDLNEEVAKEMSLYRITPESVYGSDVVYHVATTCTQGVYISSVYDAIAGFQRLYPWVNTEYVLGGPGVKSIGFVGSIGGVPATADVVGVGESLCEEVCDDAVVVTTSGVDVDRSGATSLVGQALACYWSDAERPVDSLLTGLAERVFTDSREWVSVYGGVYPPVLGDGVCMVVPRSVVVRLSNGVMVGSDVREVALLMSGAVDVVQVTPACDLVQEALEGMQYHDLLGGVVGSRYGRVVVRPVGATLRVETSCDLFAWGDGVCEESMGVAKLFDCSVVAGREDSVTVSVRTGEARVGPVVLGKGGSVMFLERKGTLGFTVLPMIAGTFVMFQLDGAEVRRAQGRCGRSAEAVNEIS